MKTLHDRFSYTLAGHTGGEVINVYPAYYTPHFVQRFMDTLLNDKFQNDHLGTYFRMMMCPLVNNVELGQKIKFEFDTIATQDNLLFSIGFDYNMFINNTWVQKVIGSCFFYGYVFFKEDTNLILSCSEVNNEIERLGLFNREDYDKLSFFKLMELYKENGLHYKAVYSMVFTELAPDLSENTPVLSQEEKDRLTVIFNERVNEHLFYEYANVFVNISSIEKYLSYIPADQKEKILDAVLVKTFLQKIFNYFPTMSTQVDDDINTIMPPLNKDLKKMIN